jgi:hypothetical protein
MIVLIKILKVMLFQLYILLFLVKTVAVSVNKKTTVLVQKVKYIPKEEKCVLGLLHTRYKNRETLYFFRTLLLKKD